MLVIGIDVAILSAFGLVLIVASYAFSRLFCLSQEEGSVCVATTAVVSLLMVIFYVAMAFVLDAITPVL